MKLNLQEHRRHLEHQQRELYEHNVDEPCPCGLCARERFETRATAIILGALAAVSLIAYLAVRS